MGETKEAQEMSLFKKSSTVDAVIDEAWKFHQKHGGQHVLADHASDYDMPLETRDGASIIHANSLNEAIRLWEQEGVSQRDIERFRYTLGEFYAKTKRLQLPLDHHERATWEVIASECERKGAQAEAIQEASMGPGAIEVTEAYNYLDIEEAPQPSTMQRLRRWFKKHS